MSDLIIIIGPPASGKAAVGLALSQLMGFRFFHNHMTSDPVAALFGWGTKAYFETIAEVRLTLLAKALAQPAPPIVFTYVWAFNAPADNDFIAKLTRLGGRVFFVELTASLKTRVAREGTPLRVALKPAKQDVERARAYHTAIEKYRMNSQGDFPYPDRHLIVDTESRSPNESAVLIAKHFGFHCPV